MPRGKGLRVFVFSGRVAGDELTLSWTRESLAFPQAPAAMFGGPLPSPLVLRRVPTVEAPAPNVQGREFAAAVSLPRQDLRVTGQLFVADATARVRAIIVVPEWGAGDRFYPHPTIRRVLVEGESVGILRVEFATLTEPIARNPRYDTADAIVTLLDRLAQDAGRPELRQAPLLFWAHSAGGGVGPAFAARYPARTVGFVQYHTGSGLVVDPADLKAIPALHLKGGLDTSVLGDAELLWRAGRAAGAPWTFSLDPDATHGGEEPFVRSQLLTIPWMQAVLRLRVPADGGALRPITVAPGPANWLPDEASATGWRTVAAGAP